MATRDFSSIADDLAKNGYAVVPNILTDHEISTAKDSFYMWLDSHPDIKKKHNAISPHGIFKFFEAGHQRHAWFIRTRKAVQDVFKTLWKTDDLVVSFDGSCWIDKDVAKTDTVWTHTDQAPNKVGVHCYQAFVSLTSNKERTLIVYENSHNLHEEYMKERNLTDAKNWLKIDASYLEKIKDTRRVLEVEAGSLVIWDSRTFHQNQYGRPGEERIVQYVSYLPKEKRSKAMKTKRTKYLEERRTTSHWPYPVNVNGLQPQTYGNKEMQIDYSQLPKPDLDDLADEIDALI